MSRLTRDGTANPISRDPILRRERGQGNLIFPVYMRDHTYIHEAEAEGRAVKYIETFEWQRDTTIGAVVERWAVQPLAEEPSTKHFPPAATNKSLCRIA